MAYVWGRGSVWGYDEHCAGIVWELIAFEQQQHWKLWVERKTRQIEKLQKERRRLGRRCCKMKHRGFDGEAWRVYLKLKRLDGWIAKCERELHGDADRRAE